MDSEPGVYLNSELDVVDEPRLNIASGVWTLQYTVFAVEFPVLSVVIELDVTNWNKPCARILRQEAF